jgi:hypothetical protein
MRHEYDKDTMCKVIIFMMILMSIIFIIIGCVTLFITSNKLILCILCLLIPVNIILCAVNIMTLRSYK